MGTSCDHPGINRHQMKMVGQQTSPSFPSPAHPGPLWPSTRPWGRASLSWLTLLCTALSSKLSASSWAEFSAHLYAQEPGIQGPLTKPWVKDVMCLNLYLLIRCAHSMRDMPNARTVSNTSSMLLHCRFSCYSGVQGWAVALRSWNIDSCWWGRTQGKARRRLVAGSQTLFYLVFVL